MKAHEIKIGCDNTPIEMDSFVQEFICHVVDGLLEALKDTGKAKLVHITIEADQMTIALDNVALPMNAFVNRIARSTLSGMVSSLKGVRSGARVVLEIQRS